jgi:hypothetical protein
MAVLLKPKNAIGASCGSKFLGGKARFALLFCQRISDTARGREGCTFSLVHGFSSQREGAFHLSGRSR